jgi:hypothetical protein
MHVAADGCRVRIDSPLGTFFIEAADARRFAADVNCAVDDLLSRPGRAAHTLDYDDAIRDHRAWQERMDAEMRGDCEC